MEIEYKYLFGEREKLAKGKTDLQDKRKALQSAMQLNFDSDLKLKKILYSADNKDFDVNEAIKLYIQYNKTCKNHELLSKVRSKLSVKKEESINEGINKKTIKDKIAVEKIIEEINNCRLIISNSTLGRMREIIDESNISISKKKK